MVKLAGVASLALLLFLAFNKPSEATSPSKDAVLGVATNGGSAAAQLGAEGGRRSHVAVDFYGEVGIRSRTLGLAPRRLPASELPQQRGGVRNLSTLLANLPPLPPPQSLCPDCQHMVRDVLAPLYTNGVSKLMELRCAAQRSIAALTRAPALLALPLGSCAAQRRLSRLNPGCLRAQRSLASPLRCTPLYWRRYIAYGNAKGEEKDKVQCQHGEPECRFNRYLNCAQHLHPKQEDWCAVRLPARLPAHPPACPPAGLPRSIRL